MVRVVTYWKISTKPTRISPASGTPRSAFSTATVAITAARTRHDAHDDRARAAAPPAPARSAPLPSAQRFAAAKAAMPTIAMIQPTASL